MTMKHGCVLALLLGSTALMAPATADAGRYFGDWSWCWHPGCDCPKGEYCPLHYWAPGIYKVRAYVHPSNLDEYPAGPCPPVPATYETIKYPCRSVPPTPMRPYSDPAGYFGRPVASQP